MIELLITIAILGILATVAVPSFISSLARSSMDTAVSDMAATLAFARSEAIGRSLRVVTCRSAAPYAAEAALACGGAGTWESGWVTFADSNSDGAFAVGEVLLRRRGSSSNLTITTGANYATLITYDAAGRPTQNDTFTFTPSAASGLAARTIAVSRSGRLNISQ
ncbi:MAG: GspH/FimT family pseudopilin [Betaproteobacteria bacterium]|nr:GspH/FimT family pseudopilin [Betaproteobacteria bacterium]